MCCGETYIGTHWSFMVPVVRLKYASLSCELLSELNLV